MGSSFFLLFSASLAWGQEIAIDDEQPVVDRIILTPKKKKKLPPAEAPVVDRIFLTPKKKKPAGLTDEEAEAMIARIKAKTPQPVIEPAPVPSTNPTDVPVGLLVNFAYRTGALDGVQLGLAYWFDESWGLGLQSGYTSHRGTKTVTYASGQRRVTGMAWSTSPELSLLFSPVQASRVRLITELGGGMHFTKLERVPFTSGVHAQAGLGVQWAVLDRLSIQLGERLQWVGFRGAEPADDIRLGTQMGVSWCFECPAAGGAFSAIP